MAEFGSLGKFFIGIGVDLAELRSGMRQATSEMSRANGEIQRSAGGIAKSLGDIGKQAAGFALGQAGLDGLSAAFNNTAVAGFKFNAMMEQSKISFETMLGGAEKADKMLKDLYDFAAKTPFEFKDLQEAAKKMLAMGFAANDLLPTLKSVGDAAAGLGLSGADGTQRIIRALGQMQMKAKVSAEEMLQLSEAGIPAWAMLAEAMGKSTAEVMKLSEKGLIPADFAVKALVDGMGKRFPDMMDKQSKSFNGLMSTMKDNLAQTFGTVMKPTFEYFSTTLMPKATKALEDFNAALKSGGLSEAFKTMFPTAVVDAFTLALDGCAKAFNLIVDNWNVIYPTIIAATGAWAAYNGIMLAGKIAVIAHAFAQGVLTGSVALSTAGTIAATAANIGATAATVASTTATYGLAAGFRALALAMNLNPVVLAISLAVAAIIGIIWLIRKNWDTIIEKLRQAWTTFTNWWAGMWDNMFGFLERWGIKVDAKTKDMGNRIRKNMALSMPKITDVGESMDAGLGRNRSRSDYRDAGGAGGNSSTTTTTPETVTPVVPDGSTGASKSPFEQAEALYNHEVKMAQLSASERLAVYQRYMTDVTKTAEELRKFQEQIYELERAVQSEKVDRMKVDLDKMKLDTTKTYEEILAAELKVAQAETALHKEGTVEYERAKLNELSYAQRLNSEKVELNRVALERMKLDGTKTQTEILNAELKVAQAETALLHKGSAEYERAKNKELDIEKQLAAEKIRLENEVQAHKRRLRQLELDQQAQNIDQLAELGLISDREQLMRQRALIDERLALELKAIQDQIDSGKLSADKVAELEREKVEIVRRSALKRSGIEHKLMVDTHRYQLDAFKTIRDGFGDAVEGMLKGTMSFRKGLQSIVGGIRNIFAKMAGDVVRNWVVAMFRKTALGKLFAAQDVATHTAAEATKQGVTAAGVGVHVAAETTKAGASIAASAAGATASVTATTISFGALWKAMLATAKSILSIPVVGWIIGGLMIAGIVSAITSSKKGLDTASNLQNTVKMPSYDVGSWNIGFDHVAKVHKGEVIVPEPFANKARALMSGEAGGGSTNVKVEYNVTAVDAKSVKDMLKDHGRVIVDVIKDQHRNFAFGR